ncbi:DUF2637 domain-containing protein [Haloglycomyces albus]|uniref:DUF2637 domain-containing protein n=1 Tax=Haloglycomyces albus TaxID=526067 RepID=UPI00046D49DF|nr:DUF2637 domain-containing protein [Haloglycomyces albus]
MTATPTPASDEPDDNSNTDDLARSLLGTVWCEGCDRSVDECSCERVLRLQFGNPEEKEGENEEASKPGAARQSEHDGSNEQTPSTVSNPVDGEHAPPRSLNTPRVNTPDGDRVNDRSDESVHSQNEQGNKVNAAGGVNATQSGERLNVNTPRTPHNEHGRNERVKRRSPMMVCIAVLSGCLALVGFAASFGTVAASMEPSFGRMAVLVPIGIDLGIIVFSLLDIELARRDYRIRWLRYVPWALTAGTIWLNLSAGHTVEEKLAHAALPALWVVTSEVLAHVKRRETRQEKGVEVEPIPKARWLCAPIATLKLWRVMRLWNIRSYTTALDSEIERQLARSEMTSRWGSVRKSPGVLRVRYRNRMITLTQVVDWKGSGGNAGVNTSARSTQPERSRPGDTTATVNTTVQSGKQTRSPKPGAKRSGQQTEHAGSKVNASKRSKASARERLAEALAAFIADGKNSPSFRELADRAGVSVGTVHKYKNHLGLS